MLQPNVSVLDKVVVLCWNPKTSESLSVDQLIGGLARPGGLQLIEQLVAAQLFPEETG